MALSAEAERFAQLVARDTGLELPTVRAWVLSEGGSADNPLNVMQFDDADNRSIRRFGSADAAARYTVNLLNTARYTDVLTTARRTTDPLTELGAIADSPWEENQYRGNTDTPGALLLGAFRSLNPTAAAAVPIAATATPVFDPRDLIPGGLLGRLQRLLDELFGLLPGLGLSGLAADIAQGLLAPFTLLGTKLGYWLEQQALVALGYVLLNALALALVVRGLMQATGTSPGDVAALVATRGRSASAGRRSQTDDIPF